jgi:hypothetical protein
MEYLVQGNLPLARGSNVRIENGRGMLVYVWSGSVWITQAGDRRDRHVGAGGWFRIDRGGLALITALGRSAVSLTSPRELGFAERIEVVRAGGAVQVLHAEPGWLARLTRRWQELFAPVGALS